MMTHTATMNMATHMVTLDSMILLKTSWKLLYQGCAVQKQIYSGTKAKAKGRLKQAAGGRGRPGSLESGRET
eukprot:scaffold4691_cov97-Skeletonema_dohrnii-CCMP3373.AAC.1